jgi:chromosome partitioning protein
MSAVIVSLLNQKGGVGKTTTVFHLGGHFALEGRRVLVCDMDPQASLTQGFFGPQAVYSLAAEESVAALFDDASPIPPVGVLRPTTVDGLSILPGSPHLNRFNTPEPRNGGFAQVALRDALNELRDRFDFILIDCPPNLGLCSWSSLAASDFVVVPFQPEDFGCQGIYAIQQTVAAVTSEVNPTLKLGGYLLTMVDSRRSLHKAYEEILRSNYGDRVFATKIPDAAVFAESIPKRLPVAQYKPKSAAARAVRDFANELLLRVNSHELLKEVA